MTIPPDQTSVTRNVTRGRLKRLKAINGADWDTVLALCEGDESQAARVIDAVCAAWFGPIFRFPNTPPRSDRGGSHAKPQRDEWCFCQWCGGEFYRARPDARYCCNAHRQAAYRDRQ